MTVKDFLKLNNIKRNSDVDFALCFCINKKRSELDFALINKKQAKQFLGIKKKLDRNIPLDLVLKISNFYGRKFYVNKHVLKPRLDSELVCEQALKLTNEKTKVLDLCCGSGVLGITISKEKYAYVVFGDISRKALKVCKKNVKAHDVKGKIIRGNLFENINEKFDLIICNPPYIKSSEIEKLDYNVKKYDPKIALDGGEDGLDFYKKIIEQAPDFLNENGKIVFEIGFDQGFDVKRLMKKDFTVHLMEDLSGNDRIIIGEKNG